MCGIAGIARSDGQAIPQDKIVTMCRVMEHRGPDDEGIYLAEGIGLGHRRLAVIDLSPAGHQPMANEDGSIWISYNGEIYNFRELRRDLASKGHRFRSHTDAEVVIHAYEEYGEDCLHQFIGMFAFALWDQRNQRLFLARDRLGIKPLFYARRDGAFIFASELKAILASGLVSREVSLEAVHHYLSLGVVPSPLTIFEGIDSLLPGHRIILENGDVQLEPYWRLEFPQDGLGGDYDEDYYRSKLRELLEDAVGVRQVADVPIGAFLSGGIDSSTVVGLMSQIVDGPVHTFSIGFGVEGREIDETSYAQIAASRFSTQHRESIITGDDVLSHLPRMIWYMDQPSAGTAIETYFVSAVASQDVTVALSGLGGDELFAGYGHYLALANFQRYRHLYEQLPPPLKGLVQGAHSRIPAGLKRRLPFRKLDTFLSDFDERYMRGRSSFSEREKRDLYTQAHASRLGELTTKSFLGPQFVDSKDWNFINQRSYLDLRNYMGEELLPYSDRMSMAHSLEVRTPLIDHRLVEFVATVPPGLKLKGWCTKYLLRQAVQDLLPPELLARGKQGFALPLAWWMRHQLRPVIDSVLSPESVAKRGYFRFEAVQRECQRFYRGKGSYFQRVWALFVLELWHRLYVDNASSGADVKLADIL